MKILVCIKAVPNDFLHLRLNAGATGYDEDGIAFRVNEYDLCAMEEAARIKERLGGEITVVSLGPPRIIEQIKKAMALGADHGLLLDDPVHQDQDALSIASRIAAWAQDKNFDLILCGVMSEDMQRSQTGPMLAQILGLPCATTVIAERISDDCATITCERELEGGQRERAQLPLPALITVQSGINVPRYASLSNVLRVKQYQVPTIASAALAPGARSEIIQRAYFPARATRCEFLTGSAERIAEKLAEKIRAGNYE